MRALTFQSVKTVEVQEVDEPARIDPRDAIVSVELTAICGSDLHPYLGREVGLDVGTVLGHEFLGKVLEVGEDVGSVAPGDTVVAPFTTSCGQCFHCEQGLTARCIHGELFGWVEQGRGLHGAQAERVRVPLADSTLLRVPEGARPEEALLAGDVLSTGFFCAQMGGVGPGTSVAVIGAGPVGLSATIAARELGAAEIFTLDLQPERLALAERYGARALNASTQDHRTQILDRTAGRGVDAVLECVGTPGATRSAYDLVRAGGTIAAAGVHTEEHLAFGPGEAYDKNLTYRAGRCPARAMMEKTLPLAASGRHDLGALFSHRLSLEEAVRGYELFEKRLDGCTKVLLTP